MPIERLLQPTINVRDFQPHQEYQPKSARERYAALKRTDLYDRESGQWVQSLDETRQRDSLDQLLGIIIEEKFDRKTAHVRYESLKESRFYNKSLEYWNWYIEGGITHADNKTGNQLVGILVESLFDKEKAKKDYEALKQDRSFKLYDAKNDRWNQGRNSNRQTFQDQAYAILIEAELYDKDVAKEKYEKLKETGFYDKNRDQWKFEINDETIYTNNQFLAILIEDKLYNKPMREKYETLKNSSFYNKAKRGWKFCEDSTDIYSEDQLLALLIETKIEPDFTPEKGVSVPEIRVF